MLIACQDIVQYAVHVPPPRLEIASEVNKRQPYERDVLETFEINRVSFHKPSIK
jgi:hypothetical protein